MREITTVVEEYSKKDTSLLLNINNEIDKVYIPHLKYFLFNCINSKINEKVLEEVFLEIFDEKYTFEEYMKQVTYLKRNDRYERVCPNELKQGLEMSEIYLTPLDSARTISSYIHEFTHARILANGLEEEKENSEFIARITDMIAIDLLDEKLGSKYINGEYVDNLIEMKGDYRFIFHNMYLLNKYIEKGNVFYTLECKQYIKESLLYILSRIYGIKTMDLYKKDKKHVLNNVKKVLTNEKQVEDFLKDYEISFDKESTINPTLKLIKKYGIKYKK